MHASSIYACKHAATKLASHAPSRSGLEVSQSFTLRGLETCRHGLYSRQNTLLARESINQLRAGHHDTAENGLHSEDILAARVDGEESSSSSRRGVSGCDSLTVHLPPHIPNTINHQNHSPGDGQPHGRHEVRRRVSRRFRQRHPCHHACAFKKVHPHV
jgi:hypothetical protein